MRFLSAAFECRALFLFLFVFVRIVGGRRRAAVGRVGLTAFERRSAAAGVVNVALRSGFRVRQAEQMRFDALKLGRSYHLFFAFRETSRERERKFAAFD